MQIFKEVFHRVQELSIPRSKNLGKEVKRLAWLSRELLVKLKEDKQIQTVKTRNWEGYRDL